MTVFGVDFGTTNSLAAMVVGERVQALVDTTTARPHPSVVWYRGGDVIVGREARQNMDLTDAGAPPGFVRSPKMKLRREGPIFVDGRVIDPVDAVAEVLKHLRADAALSRGDVDGQRLDRAIMTIPVDFGGMERRALREAARKAGIGVVQFVHEPAAALYAYLRSQDDIQHELARLEGRSVLVFDWGGGTLDLTLCRISGGTILQVASLGDNEVGGDRFDERLRNLLVAKHATAHGIEDVVALEQPGMAAKLLHECERIKIDLSAPGVADEDVIIRNFLKVDGPAQTLRCKVTRAEFEKESAGIVNRGLARIEEILARSSLSKQDVALCLATGGMINMPAIWDGLIERFPGRVPPLPNGDRIIAEGAAWIAHDDLRLTLSKPIEILVADGSGAGSYYPLVEAGWTLPLENEVQNVTNTRLFCTDPREGVALVEVAKPRKLGITSPYDARTVLCVAKVKVDPTAAPIVERIECSLQVDHDYVAKVTLRSSGRKDEQSAEFYDLEFALALPNAQDWLDRRKKRKATREERSLRPSVIGNLLQRANVAPLPADYDTDTLWRSVPGDLVARWRPSYFEKRIDLATDRQREELSFYNPCALCGRSQSQLRAQGPVAQCRGDCLPAQHLA